MDDDEPVETDPQRQWREVIEGTVVALLGTGVALAVPGVGGALAGAATGSVLGGAWDVVRQRARGQVERTVAHGVARAELTPGAFTEWVADDPRHGGLLVAVVEAAARATAEAHLDALARVLADGARDDARVDEDTLAARALGAMGPAHLQLLALIAEDDPRSTPAGAVPAYSLAHVGRRRPHLAATVDALMAGLMTTGATRADASTYNRSAGETYYTVTTFGRRCLAFLDDRHSPAADDTGER